jgi:hypothetical protein
MTDILSLIVRTYNARLKYLVAEKKLRSLGEYLINIGNLPLDQLEEFIRLLWLESAAKKIEYLDFLLDYYHRQPDFWGKDVEYLKRKLKTALTQQYAYLPADIGGTCNESERLTVFRDLIEDYGNLLVWWPTILCLTDELSAGDTTFLRPIS